MANEPVGCVRRYLRYLMYWPILWECIDRWLSLISRIKYSTLICGSTGEQRKGRCACRWCCAIKVLIVQRSTSGWRWIWAVLWMSWPSGFYFSAAIRRHNAFAFDVQSLDARSLRSISDGWRKPHTPSKRHTFSIRSERDIYWLKPKLGIVNNDGSNVDWSRLILLDGLVICRLKEGLLSQDSRICTWFWNISRMDER